MIQLQMDNVFLQSCVPHTLFHKESRVLCYITLIYFVSVQVVLSEARTGVQQQYGAIREALEQEEQLSLQCVRKEESRVLGGLEEKLGHLRSALQSIQQGLHTMEGLADAKGDHRIQDQAFIMVCWMLGDEPVCWLVKYLLLSYEH